MVGCQSEVQRATQDLWTQITSWEVDTNPYASTAAWVCEEIAQPESPSRNRQAVWWSDQSSATALTNRPSVDTSGHSAKPAGDTSTVHTLPGHHCC